MSDTPVFCFSCTCVHVSVRPLPVLALLLLTGCSDRAADNAIAEDRFRIVTQTASTTVQEGGAPLEIAVSVRRGSTHRLPVTLEALDISGADTPLTIAIEDNILTPPQTDSLLSVSLAVGMLPLLPGTERTVELVATDSAGAVSTQVLNLPVSPTSLPDVYLLAGQSNMVGFSGTGTKQAAPGEPDAPRNGIWQLNVNDNDEQSFPVAAAFTTPGRIAIADPLFVLAEDPLHESRGQNTAGKSGDFIGPGLSFAKQAAAATSADIYLVPSAWSDTGFCARDTSHLAAMGWHATEPTDGLFSGTLLLDRAVARTNLVLEETGGVLRGILWHQGEADTGVPACAEAYATNLAAMVAALRERIAVDARGPTARGADAAVPFVLGTMSRGGELADFDMIKQLVDDAHRNIATLIPYATFVNNDDLVPPAYPCGQGNCIHFGAAAYREMGTRYHGRLIDAASL